MTNYLYLYGEGASHETEEERANAMQVWTDWFTKLGAAVKDPGNALSGVAKTVGSDGSTTDGPVGPAPSGYTVVTADTIDAAAQLAKGCPILSEGGSVGVYEIVDM